jgi:hypothetical protein
VLKKIGVFIGTQSLPNSPFGLNRWMDRESAQLQEAPS